MTGIAVYHQTLTLSTHQVSVFLEFMIFTQFFFVTLICLHNRFIIFKHWFTTVAHIVWQSNPGFSYFKITYSKGGKNMLSILQNSKDSLEYIQSAFFLLQQYKTFDFATLCISMSNLKIKVRLKEFILLCYFKKNCQRRIRYLVLYFVI